MKKNGFTIIEVAIVLAIALIFIGMLTGPIKSPPPEDTSEYPSTNFNETQLKKADCINGLSFYNGKQIIGTNGAGVACE